MSTTEGTTMGCGWLGVWPCTLAAGHVGPHRDCTGRQHMTKPDICTREWHTFVVSSDAALRANTSATFLLRITARRSEMNRRCLDCGSALRITLATARRLGNS